MKNLVFIYLLFVTSLSLASSQRCLKYLKSEDGTVIKKFEATGKKSYMACKKAHKDCLKKKSSQKSEKSLYCSF